VNLDGLRLLDVGCGRGGTIRVVQRFFEPTITLGIDLSDEAVAYCVHTRSNPTTFFQQADAESLPFASGSADVVTNVESSHAYPDVERFYREVDRVLIPGGRFLYTDLLNRTASDRHLQTLRRIGFIVELDRDITGNAVLSWEAAGSTGVSAFDRETETTLKDIGEKLYRSMRDGTFVYRMLRLCKPAQVRR
jgi:SAM-dependent methyltransferase